MKFTEKEKEVLNHRLEIGDCIADALDESDYSRTEIEECAEKWFKVSTIIFS